MLSHQPSAKQQTSKRIATDCGVGKVSTGGSSVSSSGVEAKKKSTRHKKKKPKAQSVGGVAPPVAKLPKSISEASTNWKLLLSQKSADIAAKKKKDPTFHTKNSASFLRRDRKRFQKGGMSSSDDLNTVNNNVSVGSVGEQLEATLRVGEGQKVVGKKEKDALPPLKGLNALGCFDYTHYGHLKTTILDEHKYLTEKTAALAIDCEMVGVGPLKEDALARVSVVNEFGYCLYDTFVKPKAAVTDYRTEFSGVREEDLKQAEDFQVVIKAVADLMRGSVIVGHSLKSDLDVLFLKHPKVKIRDTAIYYRKKFKKPKTPSLKSLTKDYLGVEIQKGEHSSITDAQATMRLYLFCREEWEDSVSQKHHTRVRKYWTAKEYRMAIKALGGLKTLKSRQGGK